MAIAEHHLAVLEKETGHCFKNLERLEQALTHASVHAQQDRNYERLEFFGDRVLGLVIAEMVCKHFEHATEGELAIRLNGLVNAETCAEIAEQMGLPEMIKTGADVKALGKNRLLNMYADVVEALIAVIYFDGGIEAVRPFIYRYWEERAHQQGADRRDAKTQLQEWAHRNKGGQPIYRLVRRTGPDHDPFFCMEVEVEGFVPSQGEGRSKRIAEQQAARNLLMRENVWTEKENSFIEYPSFDHEWKNNE